MRTMMSKAQCAIVAWTAVGRWSAGTEVSPTTSVSALKPARKESSSGTLIPPEMEPSV